MKVLARMKIEIDYVNLALAVYFSVENDPDCSNSFIMASNVIKELGGGYSISKITDLSIDSKNNHVFFNVFCKNRDDIKGVKDMLLMAYKRVEERS